MKRLRWIQTASPLLSLPLLQAGTTSCDVHESFTLHSAFGLVKEVARREGSEGGEGKEEGGAEADLRAFLPFSLAASLPLFLAHLRCRGGSRMELTLAVWCSRSQI